MNSSNPVSSNPAIPAPRAAEQQNARDTATLIVFPGASEQQNARDITSLGRRVSRLEDYCVLMSNYINTQWDTKKHLQEIREDLSQRVIFFEAATAEPKSHEDYHATLLDIAKYLHRNNCFKLFIQGHSNSHYWRGAELDIYRSEKRAEAVKKTIMSKIRATWKEEKGIPTGDEANLTEENKERLRELDDKLEREIEPRLKIEKKGFTDPAESFRSEKNRRVTFRIEEIDDFSDRKKPPIFLPPEDIRSQYSGNTGSIPRGVGAIN